MDESTDNVASFRQQYTYYARKLLDDLGLGDLQQPLRGQLLASIEQYVSQVLTATIMENLDDFTVDKIDEMLEEGKDQQEVITYLVASLPDIETKVATALTTAYSDMLEETEKLAEAVSAKYAAKAAGGSSDSNSDETAAEEEQMPSTPEEEPVTPADTPTETPSDSSSTPSSDQDNSTDDAAQQ